MSKLTQGTQIYFIDPEDDSVVEIICATDFNPGGNPSDTIDDTCLADTTASSRKGLRRPGQATLTVKADPTNASHLRLFELSNSDAEADQDLHFVVGWSDGIGIPPTVDSNGTFNLPTTRTWYAFDGYVADFPMNFALNTTVEANVTIQRSGPAAWIAKA
jgi:hypothetical protein